MQKSARFMISVNPFNKRCFRFVFACTSRCLACLEDLPSKPVLQLQALVRKEEYAPVNIYKTVNNNNNFIDECRKQK